MAVVLLEARGAFLGGGVDACKEALKPHLPKPWHISQKGRGACSIKKHAPHYTGNDLLSHDSGVVLPSAAESLTSVFEMGTCVSSRL